VKRGCRERLFITLGMDVGHLEVRLFPITARKRYRKCAGIVQ